MKYINKTIGTVEPCEVVLHPIYRRDGLVLINRYKTLTSTVINLLRTHCEWTMPILVISSTDFEEFIKNTHFRDHDFLYQLQMIVDEHRKLLPSIPLTLSMYVDGELGWQEHNTIEAISNVESEHVARFGMGKIELPKQRLASMKRIYSNPLWNLMGKIIKSPEIEQRVNNVKQEIVTTLESDQYLYDFFVLLRNYHDALLTHSINSMCISIMIGLSLELSVQDLSNLAFASLFSDIGYTTVPAENYQELLNSGQSTTEMKQHIANSIKIVEECPICRDKSIVMGILDHHEYVDGTGYPFGKKGDDISLFGKIIAVAKAYDDLVGGYIREKSLPFLEAQSQIWSERGKKWDVGIVSAFFYRRRYCKIGDVVTLKDNRRGEIIGFHDYVNYPFHPIIKMPDESTMDFSKIESLSSILSITSP